MLQRSVMSFRFGLKTLFVVIALFALATPFVIHQVALHQGSQGKSGFMRALPKSPSSPHFHMSALIDIRSGKARIIAIEKHFVSTGFEHLGTSFCKIDLDPARETGVLYIEGQPVVPTSELIAFMAEFGEPPVRVVLDRKAYENISKSGNSEMHPDNAVWNLCVEAALRNQISD